MAEINVNISSQDKKVHYELEMVGKPGKSAYEVAQVHGFHGTEEEWLEALKAGFESYDNAYEFPNIGRVGVSYVDTGENRIYRWDDTDMKYYCIGSDWTQINCINGGSANGEPNS